MEQLKALAATIPTNLMSATSNKFSDLERQLKAKAGSLEEVDAQRKYVAVHSEPLPHTLHHHFAPSRALHPRRFVTPTLCLSPCPACRVVAELPGKMAPLLADVEATKVCTRLWHA